jgi:antitoxin (DNA-binding transcriptional repressor) of toxin-antitoxin stability system
LTGTRVGIREFRENLSDYLESAKPVTITRHGATIGFYIPAPQKRSEADLEALRRAGEQLDILIAAAGTSEEELVADFKEQRRKRRQVKS